MRGTRFPSKAIGFLIGRYWVTIFLWFLVIVLMTGRQAIGKTRVANLDSFRALERAEECSVFRSLHRRMSLEMSEIKQRLEYQMNASAQSRANLESCARERGLGAISEDSESLAAEICNEAFRSWMSVGYRVRIAREDLVSVREGMKTLQLQMNWGCPAMPAPVPVSAPEPATPPDSVPRREGGAVELLPAPAIDWKETRLNNPRSKPLSVAAVRTHARWVSRQLSRGPAVD